MSFNKRYYQWENIVSCANLNTFESFDIWILKPDSRIAQDEQSSIFLDRYLSIKDVEIRKILKELVTEKKELIKDFLKLIDVVKNKNNTSEHLVYIENYISLFENKWPGYIEKYKNLIK